MLQKSNLATLLLAAVAVAVAPTSAAATTIAAATTTKNPDCAVSKGMCCKAKENKCHVLLQTHLIQNALQ